MCKSVKTFDKPLKVTINTVMTMNYSKVNNFDVLRFILAFLVIFYHTMVLSAFNAEGLLFHLAGFAVDCFFVVSGMLIMWSYDAGPFLAPYVIKRFFRIYPLYFILIIIQSVILLLLTNRDFAEILPDFLKYVSANLLFLNFVQPSIPGVFDNFAVNAVNGSLWTLKIEVTFYFTLPLIYYLFKKFGDIVLYICFIFSVLFFFYFSYKGYSLHFTENFPAQLRFFAVGMLLYRFGYRLPRLNRYVSIAAIAVLFALHVYAVKNFVTESVVYPVLLGLIVYLFAFGDFKIHVRHDMSYGIYVLHFP
ncbi:MAG: acyltransferase, partial [Oligoflexia bacterium]|nr:acyltransferase [Oligoflexia bacterium]